LVQNVERLPIFKAQGLEAILNDPTTHLFVVCNQL